MATPLAGQPLTDLTGAGNLGIEGLRGCPVPGVDVRPARRYAYLVQLACGNFVPGKPSRPLMTSSLLRGKAVWFGLTAVRSTKAHAAAAVGLILLVGWLQWFVGVHELRHLGQVDASACQFALVASTVGNAGTQAVPELLCPSELRILAPLAVPVSELLAETSTLQARAPPALA
jgi:hypothetical protein